MKRIIKNEKKNVDQDYPVVVDWKVDMNASFCGQLKEKGGVYADSMIGEDQHTS